MISVFNDTVDISFDAERPLMPRPLVRQVNGSQTRRIKMRESSPVGGDGAFALYESGKCACGK
jgi:hypothetical protein